MASDLLTVRLPPRGPVPPLLRPVSAADRESLAALYLASYPPETGAADPAAALQEMDATFAGEYGVLLPRASLLTPPAGAAVGCVLVTERSIWDEGLEGPFVIDLFVEPASRGRGLGRALVTGAMAAARAGGATTLSLRVGAGTSPAAHALYRGLGFREA